MPLDDSDSQGRHVLTLAKGAAQQWPRQFCQGILHGMLHEIGIVHGEVEQFSCQVCQTTPTRQGSLTVPALFSAPTVLLDAGICGCEGWESHPC